MGKVLIMVRTSTDKQSTEDQKKELIQFCVDEGYKRENIVCIEKQGASAAKVDDEYRQMIDEVKSRIEHDRDIKCFAVWHLNRLARTEEVWIELKTFFVKHQVQIICKNPYLKLLTPDGRIDQGMELAMGLMAILAKQDQEERKAKFKRAKTSMLSKGQYIGGHTVKYGYKVVDKNFVADDEESGVVRLIFDLYSTGNYSSYSLSKELKERGFDVSCNFINKTLRCAAYKGDEVGEYGLHYPPIISKELFDRCAIIRQGNKIDMKRGKRICLGSKIVRCPNCGAACTSNSKHYVCCRSHYGPCTNSFALRQDVADELLYRYAYGLHMMWLMNISEGKMQEYRKELEIVDDKLETTQKKIDAFGQKKQRIIDTYLEGLLDKKTRDLRLSKLEDDAKYQRDYCNSLQDKRRAIMRLLSSNDTNTVENFMRAAAAMTEEDKYTIIHKHIESLVAVQESYGKRDPRTSRPNAVHITIKAIEGSTVEYLYFPKYYEGRNLYILIDGKWVPDTLEHAVYAMPED